MRQMQPKSQAVKEFVTDTGVAHVAKTTVTIDSRTYWRNSQTGQYAVAYTVHMGPFSVTLEPIHL